jgi:hypothetical protein
MNDSPEPVPPFSEDLLDRLVPLPANAALEEALRQRTTGLVRRQRSLRRSGFAAALAACYAAGLLTMNWLPSPIVPDDGPHTEQSSELASAVPASTPSSDDAKPATGDAAPAALEWQALDSRSRSPALLRAAGDRYLQETGDVQSAVRCYRNLLQEGSGAEPTISTDDSWLLMALKEAKQREKRYANNDG